MAEVNLRSLGIQFGRTTGQAVSLKTLRLDGYTRTLSADGYRKVNPYEVGRGRADDPNSTSTEWRLSAWVAYSQSYCAPGSNLAYSDGYDTISTSWSLPTGYLASLCDQELYVKDTGQTSINDTALAVNPFSSPSQTQGVGDTTSASVNLASYSGRYVALGVKSKWNDGTTTYEAADDGAYGVASGQTALTGAGTGILVRAWEGTPPSISAVQLTDPDSCSVGDNVTLRVSHSLEGTSQATLQQQVNGGSWTTVSSSVAAGSSYSDLSRARGNAYQFRIRYNDVTPDSWRTQSGTVSAICNLA